jgi:hypothetical protein
MRVGKRMGSRRPHFDANNQRAALAERAVMPLPDPGRCPAAALPMSVAAKAASMASPHLEDRRTPAWRTQAAMPRRDGALQDTLFNGPPRPRRRRRVAGPIPSKSVYSSKTFRANGLSRSQPPSRFRTDAVPRSSICPLATARSKASFPNHTITMVRTSVVR